MKRGIQSVSCSPTHSSLITNLRIPHRKNCRKKFRSRSRRKVKDKLRPIEETSKKNRRLLFSGVDLSQGIAYDTRVVRKKPSQKDKDTHKFFQGKSAAALQNLIKSTPLDTDDNRKLFMR
ncbi:hypothetical protein PIB30_061212 [Stylosanthes scabra]|uniref:Uncharacterized protein n=1 Tax=Stylosanthes scabra TaxID=79078 RepID=A0ABU6ZJF9_9FABA|nr:hypothetical protein [Stylosanthes scabra]